LIDNTFNSRDKGSQINGTKRPSSAM